MRSVCVEQLAQITEAKRLGLTPGHNLKENFKGRFQKVKKTFSRSSEIICHNCGELGHIRQRWPEILASNQRAHRPKGKMKKEGGPQPDNTSSEDTSSLSDEKNEADEGTSQREQTMKNIRDSDVSDSEDFSL